MRRWLVCGVLLILLVGSSVAQDLITTETPLESETPTVSELPLIPETTSEPGTTPSPSLTPVQILETNETASIPQATNTVVSPTETAFSLQTSTPTLTAVFPESTALPLETVTPASEPAFSTIFVDDFSMVDSVTWAFGVGWGYTPVSDGQALRVYNSTDPIIWQGGLLDDVATEAQLLVDYGTAVISLKQSEAGSYSASINAIGQITLTRAGVVVAEAQVSPSTPGQWRTLRMSAVGAVIRVSVDERLLITYSDSTPLPAGQITFGAEFAPLPDDYGTPYPPVNTVMIDNVIISIPVNGVFFTATPTPSPSLTASLTPTATLNSNPDESGDIPVMSSFNVQSTCVTEGLAVKLLSDFAGIRSMDFDMERLGNGAPDYGYNPVCSQDLTPFEGLNALGEAHVYKALTISPDGHHIAFMSNHDGNSALAVYIMNANGSGVRRVTGSGLSAYDIKSISWSPDGDQLAFIAQLDLSPNDTYLYVIDSDGTDLTPIKSDTKISSAMWSPINDQIAVTELTGTIGLVNPDGLGYTTVSVDDPDTTYPEGEHSVPYAVFWSPDGSTVYYNAIRPLQCYNDNSTCHYSQIYSVNAGGGTATNLSKYPSCYECVTTAPADVNNQILAEESITTIGPDGRILFRANAYDYVDGEEYGLWARGEFVMLPDGSGPLKHSRGYAFYDWGLLDQEPRPPTPVPTVAPTATLPTPEPEYFIAYSERVYFVEANGAEDGIFIGSAAETQKLIPVPTQIADGSGETTLEAVGRIDVGLPVAGARTLAFECAVTDSPHDICLANLELDGSVTNIRRYIATNDKYEHLGGLNNGGWNLVWLQTDTADVRDPDANGQIFTAVTYNSAPATGSLLSVDLSDYEDVIFTDVMWGEDGWLYLSLESSVDSSASGIYRYNTHPDIFNGEYSYLTDQRSLSELFGIDSENILSGQLSLNDNSTEYGVLFEAYVQYTDTNQTPAQDYKIGLLDTPNEPVLEATGPDATDAMTRYAAIFGFNKAVLVRNLEQNRSFAAYYYVEGDGWQEVALTLGEDSGGAAPITMLRGNGGVGEFAETGFKDISQEGNSESSCRLKVTYSAGANVRDTPSTSGVIINTIPFNTEVLLTGRHVTGEGADEEVWYQIGAGQTYANRWMNLGGFKPIPEASLGPCGASGLPDTYTDTSTGCSGLAVGALKARRMPDRESEFVRNVPAGTAYSSIYAYAYDLFGDAWYLTTPVDTELAEWVIAGSEEGLAVSGGACSQLPNLTPPPTPTPTSFPSSKECISGPLSDSGFNVWSVWDKDGLPDRPETHMGTFLEKTTVYGGQARVRGVFVSWEDDQGRWFYIEPLAENPYKLADGRVGPAGWHQLVGWNPCTGNNPHWTALPRVIPTDLLDPNNPFIWVYDPTATPTGPTQIPTDAPDYSNVFPYPLYHNQPIRLTNCGSGGSEIVMGRDLNPLANSGNYPAIASANGKIDLVDIHLDGEYVKATSTSTPLPLTLTPIGDTVYIPSMNAGLGNYVVYSIPMREIPSEVKQGLIAFIQLQRQSQIADGTFDPNLETDGEIHIAFGHLMGESWPENPIFTLTPENPASIMTPVGISGNIGNAEANHLDVAVYYSVQEGLTYNYTGYEIASSNGATQEVPNTRLHYNTFFFNFLTRGFDVVQIDPLVLWPSLQNEAGCKNLAYFPDPQAKLTATPTLVPTPIPVFAPPPTAQS